MLIKSALRDLLSGSDGMINITMMSHLRWLSPLWCLTAPPSPRGIGRATKGKRLYGQARRLTSPDLHILCRMCTVDNKAPQSNPFTQRIAKNKVPPPGGRWWRQPPKGVHFLAHTIPSQNPRDFRPGGFIIPFPSGGKGQGLYPHITVLHISSHPAWRDEGGVIGEARLFSGLPWPGVRGGILQPVSFPP